MPSGLGGVTQVVVGARSEPAVTQALTGLIPLLRRRWTEERLARQLGGSVGFSRCQWRFGGADDR